MIHANFAPHAVTAKPYALPGLAARATAPPVKADAFQAGESAEVVERPSFSQTRPLVAFVEPDATEAELRAFVAEQNGTILVNSGAVAMAAKAAQGQDVTIASLVGGPLGATPSTVKAFEASRAVENGAQQVLISLNLGALKDGDSQVVRDEIQQVQAAAGQAEVKVLLDRETFGTHFDEARGLAEEAGVEVVEQAVSPKRKGLHGLTPCPDNPAPPRGLSDSPQTRTVLEWLAKNPTTIGQIFAADDHTNLKAGATREDISTLSQQASDNQTASACVNPYRVAETAQALAGTTTKTCTVVGFPWGSADTEVKAFETRVAIEKGADEIDMVVNVGQVRAGRWDQVREDIEAVVEAAGDKPVKVILETAFLDDDQIRQASEASMDAGAEFVKTSTGFAPRGARAHHLEIMRDVAGDKGVKASGDVRTLWDALVVLSAGANRIGASSMLKNFVKAGFDPGLVVTPENLATLLAAHPEGSVAGY